MEQYFIYSSVLLISIRAVDSVGGHNENCRILYSDGQQRPNVSPRSSGICTETALIIDSMVAGLSCSCLLHFSHIGLLPHTVIPIFRDTLYTFKMTGPVKLCCFLTVKLFVNWYFLTGSTVNLPVLLNTSCVSCVYKDLVFINKISTFWESAVNGT